MVFTSCELLRKCKNNSSQNLPYPSLLKRGMTLFRKREGCKQLCALCKNWNNHSMPPDFRQEGFQFEPLHTLTAIL